MSAWARIAKFYRKQAIFWCEQEERWRETKEFCHQKVLEIIAIRERYDGKDQRGIRQNH